MKKFFVYVMACFLLCNSVLADFEDMVSDSVPSEPVEAAPSEFVEVEVIPDEIELPLEKVDEIVKNYAPDIDKQVKDKVNATYQKAADYNVGDEIPYKITVTVPQNITRLKKFEVTDTPTNLVDQVKDAGGNTLISVQYQNGESLVDVAVEAYAIADFGDGGFKVTFDTSKMSAYAGKQIVISYNAKLTASADMTTAGNKNQAKLEYSNKTDVSEDEKDKDEV